MLVSSRARVSVAVAGIGCALLGTFAVFFALLPYSVRSVRRVGVRDWPPPSPRRLCEIPPARCSAGAEVCRELVLFAPAVSAGYEDFPNGGETWDDQWASYVRRDLMMAVQYAAAKVACMTSGWTYGNGGPVVLTDMNERDGAIPGTRMGAPSHPRGSHADGNDMDIAYYQVHTPDNRPRPVCPHEVDESSVHHCVGEPDLLDPWRTALFIGLLFEQPGIRLVGVDGRIAPIIEAHLEALELRGLLSTETVDSVRLGYETGDTGRGWYYFHHHHMHVSAVWR
jgi:hypothetical protein